MAGVKGRSGRRPDKDRAMKLADEFCARHLLEGMQMLWEESKKDKDCLIRFLAYARGNPHTEIDARVRTELTYSRDWYELVSRVNGYNPTVELAEKPLELAVLDTPIKLAVIPAELSTNDVNNTAITPDKIT